MNSALPSKTIVDDRCTSMVVDINLGDKITAGTCSHIIIEIIKYIVYQRLQIPYTYQWLKHLIDIKRSRDEQGKKDCLVSSRHFRTACATLNSLDSIIKSLVQEINGPALPEEVCIMFGATPVTNKEVYRLLLPSLCHKSQCHATNDSNDQKVLRTVFRSFITSGLHNKMLFEPLPTTNMYIFLKKSNFNNTSGNILVNSNNFFFVSGYRIPKRSKIAVLDFRKQTSENFTCCNNFQVYQDVCENMAVLDVNDVKNEKYSSIQSTHMKKWFQSSFVVKGFKDCIVNGSSVTNMWLEK